MLKYIPAILLMACAPSLPTGVSYLNSDDRELVDLVIETWIDEGFPYDVNSCRPTRLQVAIANEDTFNRLCARCYFTGTEERVTRECPYGYAYACFSSERWGSGLSSPIPILVIGDSWVDTHRFSGLVMHETVHWLEWCNQYNYLADHTGDVWEKLPPRLPGI